MQRHCRSSPLLENRFLAFWPQARLVVELDGYAAHGTRKAFQGDRERERHLVSAGFAPIRVAAVDLRDEPAWHGS